MSVDARREWREVWCPFCRFSLPCAWAWTAVRCVCGSVLKIDRDRV